MACKTCGQSTKTNKCYNPKLGDSHCDCVKNWAIKVETLPPIEWCTHDHVYILPTNQVFMLNYDRDAWLEIGK